MTDPAVRVVFVTGPDAASLESIGRVLVHERLAACVNILPGITSIYRWKEEVNVDPEALAMIKTTDDRVEAMRLRVSELHPYDIPEFLALEVVQGAPAYLRWVKESVTRGSRDVEA